MLLKYLCLTRTEPAELTTFQILPCIFLENIHIVITQEDKGRL